jgi:Zn-finger nucleic acid-binding protein
VWLDRGELDKILERSASMEQQPRPVDPRKRKEDTQYYDDDRYDDDYYKRNPHKKKHWLGEVFDIFD